MLLSECKTCLQYRHTPLVQGSAIPTSLEHLQLTHTLQHSQLLFSRIYQSPPCPQHTIDMYTSTGMWHKPSGPIQTLPKTSPRHKPLERVLRVAHARSCWAVLLYIGHALLYRASSWERFKRLSFVQLNGQHCLNTGWFVHNVPLWLVWLLLWRLRSFVRYSRQQEARMVGYSFIYASQDIMVLQ